MTIKWSLGLAVIAAGVAVGVACPASADPNTFPDTLEGAYTYNGGGITRTWTFTPCGSGCANVDAPSIPGSPGFSGTARLGYGGYALTLVDFPGTIACPDGSSAPGNITYRWRPSFSGQADVWSTSGACGVPGTKTYPSFGFTLTKA